MPQTSSTLFSKVLIKFYTTLQRLVMVPPGRRIFRLFFLLMCYNFSMTVQLHQNAIPYNRQLRCDTLEHSYA